MLNINLAHVFVSYMRDDEQNVHKLRSELRARNIDVWLDRDSIDPGQNWQEAIQSAIEQGAFFLACFSDAFLRRRDTYMHQELAWAAERIRVSSNSRSWLIPVRLSECVIPDLDLGGGYSVSSLQWVDLFRNWDDGVNRILRVVRPSTYVDPELERFLRDGCTRHIESKVELFAIQRRAAMGRLKGMSEIEREADRKMESELESEWRGLMDPLTWNMTVELAVQLLAFCRVADKPLTDHLIDPAKGRIIYMTASHRNDVAALLRSLGRQDASLEKQYATFIQHERRRMRAKLSGWKDRALVHWIFVEDRRTEELVVDLLYLTRFNLSRRLFALSVAFQLGGHEPHPPFGQIYPTSIMRVQDIETLVLEILREETLASKEEK